LGATSRVGESRALTAETRRSRNGTAASNRLKVSPDARKKMLSAPAWS